MGRELTDRERDLVVFLVENGTPLADDPPVSPEARRRWRAQASAALAGSPCGCGTCPSVALEDANGPIPHGGGGVVLCARHPDASLMLIIEGDRLSYLELAPHGDRPFPEFPPVAVLTVCRGSATRIAPGPRVAASCPHG
jgi:hypothetical protein